MCLLLAGGGGNQASSSRAAAPSTRARAQPNAARCVDVTPDATRRLAQSGEVQRVDKTDGLDLDRDGTPDWWLRDDSQCGTGGCLYEVYLARGACGVWVGELDYFHDRLVPEADGAFPPLRSEWRDGCCTRIDARDEYDGAAYTRTAERECQLEEDGDTFHCGSWHAPSPPE